MRKIKSLSEASVDSLWCRTEGHDYKWVNDEVTTDRTGKRIIQFDRIKKCRVCGFVSTKTIDSSWTVIKRKPGYPDDYLITGQGRIPASDVYREQYSRPEFFER